jgi:hypothetical protein
MSGKLSERRRRMEEEQAEDYAAAIRHSGWITPGWTALNEQIIEEFGRAGLLRIKRRAWEIVEGGYLAANEGVASE